MLVSVACGEDPEKKTGGYDCTVRTCTAYPMEETRVWNPKR